MDKKYITLFKDLAQATAASAETVMEYNRSKNDEQGLKTATTMRDDFQELADTIAKSKDEYIPTRADLAKLLVGATVMTNQIEERIKGLKVALTGYQTDVIPKLQKSFDEAHSDEEVKDIVNNLFIITDEN